MKFLWKLFKHTVHHGKARHDVGASAVSEPDDVLDPQLVQHRNKVLADLQEICKDN